ncbi:P-II family nitrogen regulator [Teredinibacter turnerae]|uniref:P-II family nitrogen regulator n=1 Tax=Teredinibacter turnerae TaxID=2426 RepID=UPI00037AA77C|nr:P-II family nitrogen regulator [Teredinibacter turnerae]
MSISKVVAIFDEFRLEEVEKTLLEHDIRGFTLHPVRGRGRYFDCFNENHLIKHIQIEVYTADEYAERICKLIVDAAHTGVESEGLVCIVPVKNMYWINDKYEVQSDEFSFVEFRHPS